MKNYETVFIMTPVLSDKQVKETTDKFKSYLVENGAKIVNDESWGLKQLAYPIQGKSTGFYQLFEFDADATLIDKLEVEYRRDERIFRYLTISLDKHAVAYNKRRKNGELKGQKKQKETAA